MTKQPPPPPPASLSRVAAIYGTRVSRTYEPDDPAIRKKRPRPFKLTELEHIPREHHDMYRALSRSMPEALFEPGFRAQVVELLQRYCSMQIDLWLDRLSVIETGRLRALIPKTSCILVIGLAPRAEKILVEVDLYFVYRVISSLLGGKGGAVDIHRPLTEIEQGVFLFVALKVVALLQGGWVHPEQVAIRIEDVRNDIRSAADIVRYEKRWMCVSWKLTYDLDVGTIRVLIPESFAHGCVFVRPPAGSPLSERMLGRTRERLAPFLREKTWGWVEAGNIELSREDFEKLDPGDIILLESSEVRLEEDGVSGPAVMRVGLGKRALVRGALSNQEGRQVFEIQEIVAEEVPDVHDPIEGHGELENPEQVVASYEDGAEVERELDEGDDGAVRPEDAFDEDYGADDEDDTGDEDYEEGAEGYGEDYQEEQQEEEQQEEGGDGAGEPSGGEVDDNLAQSEPLLGDIPMVLVVELGRVQLTADEVIRLRPGQLIELGRSPADPVDLVISGKLVAKGELVEIEGALGVKIVNLVKGSEG